MVKELQAAKENQQDKPPSQSKPTGTRTQEWDTGFLIHEWAETTAQRLTLYIVYMCSHTSQMAFEHLYISFALSPVSCFVLIIVT